MIKKTILISSLAITCFLQAQDVSVLTNTVDVYANPSYNGDAKYNAMVGANGALGGSATSLLTNPAGLGIAITSDVSATLNFHNYDNTSHLNKRSLTYDNRITDFSNVSGIASFKLSDGNRWQFANLGINYSHRSLDNYVETPADQSISFTKSLVDSNNNPVTGNLAFNGHAYNRKGNQSVFNLGVGANYNNTIYIGAGFNFSNASVEQLDTSALLLDLDNTNHEFSKQYTPYLEESNGFSASVGIIGKLSKQLRVGLALESPTWWMIDRAYNEYGVGTSGFINSEVYNEQRTLRTPLKTTLSASFVPNKSLAFNVDYTAGLSKIKYKEEGAAEKELNEFLDHHLKNTSEVRLGAEYRLSGLRFRAGYAYANSPFEKLAVSSVNHSSELSSPFLSDKRTIGLGIGYQFKSFFIDAAYQNVKYSTYQNVFMQGFQSYNSGYFSRDFDVSSPEAIVSNVDKMYNNISISFGWKF